MALSCDPNSLAALAKCFKCLPPATLREVQTYLLCLIANSGAGGSSQLVAYTVAPPPPPPDPTKFAMAGDPNGILPNLNWRVSDQTWN